MNSQCRVCTGKVRGTGEWIEFGVFDPIIHKMEFVQETIRLFTGQHDRYGKKIFDGDIVEYTYEAWGVRTTHHVVRWHDFGWCYLNNGHYAPMKNLDPSRITVIGNIHDNCNFAKGIMKDGNERVSEVSSKNY